MIEVSRQDEALVIRITEQQLQMYAIPQFRAMVAEALAGKPKIVIFDLELVDHMDSSAMGAMFHFLKYLGSCSPLKPEESPISQT